MVLFTVDGAKVTYKIKQQLLSSKAQTKILQYLERMLNAVGSFMEKIHSFLQKAFASIEEAQSNPRPKKPVFVMPEQPKNKWTRMHQRRMMKQGESRKKMLTPSFPLRILPSLQELDSESAIAYREKPPESGSENVRKARQQIQVSLRSVRQEERQALQALGEKMGVLSTSFNLQHLLSLPDPSWLTSLAFKSIFDFIFGELALSKSNKSNESQHANSRDSILIFQGKIRLFPAVFRAIFSNWNLELFSKRFEEQLAALPAIDLRATEVIVAGSQIQQILKQLRRAKIYRYSLTTEVQGLIGNYLYLKQGKPQLLGELVLVGDKLQLSDIGLLSPSARVEEREEAEIVHYWSQRSQQLPSGHSSYDYDYEKVLEHLRIDPQIPLTLPNYMQCLTRFQNRLILIEEERNEMTISKLRKDLEEAEKRYDAISSQTPVVRDGRSSLRKPEHPKPQFSACTPLRLFAKWRSSGCEDGFSMGSMMLRLINKELSSFEAVLGLLLRDYDTQVTIPRSRYLLEMMTAISEYEALEQKLEEEETAYRRFLQNSGFRTPRRAITLEEPMAPCKESRVWSLQAVPYEEERVEPSSFSIMQEEEESDEESQNDRNQNEDEDEGDDSDQEDEDGDGVLEGDGDTSQDDLAFVQAIQANAASDSSSSGVQEILPEEAFEEEQVIQVIDNSLSSAAPGQLAAILEEDSSEESEKNGQYQEHIVIDQ